MDRDDQPRSREDVELDAIVAQEVDEDNAAVEWDPPRHWMRGYLVALSRLGVQQAACERVGISDQSVLDWKRRDQRFAEACAAAVERYADFLERTAGQWATVGLETRTVTTKTLPDGTVEITERVSRERSPALMAKLLEGVRADKFRRNVRVEQTGAGGKPIQHEVTVVDDTVREFRQELERLGHVEEPAPLPQSDELPAA